jgi:hypothetical protein
MSSKICNKEVKILNRLHLRSHKITCKEYEEKFNVKIESWNKRKDCLNKFDKHKKRIPWNKGLNYKTDERVLKYRNTVIKSGVHRKPNPKNREHGLGRSRTFESRKKQSKTIRQRIFNGEIKVTEPKFRGAYFRKDLNKYYRSCCEANFVRILNYENISFEYEKYRFKLKNKRVYVPDFKIKNTFYEIKGYWLKNAKIKFEQFKKQYPNIKVKIIDKREYEKLVKKYSLKIENWEFKPIPREDR